MTGVTGPAEWRRRAAVALSVRERDLRCALGGLAALEADDADGVREAAARCREVVWGQPSGVAGVVVAPGLTVAAHTTGQPLSVVGTAIGFLAQAFEAFGDDADLDAAIELHDLAVALGDEVWTSAEGWRIGWGAALLFGLTGEAAYLATAERVADAVCERQHPDGSWGSTLLDAEASTILQDMADAVESRRAAGDGD